MYRKLATIMMFLLASTSVMAKNDCGKKEGDSLNVNCWECGYNCTARFDSGEMTISGSGKMYDYLEGGTPWNAKMAEIQNLVIDDNITEIGMQTFSNAVNLASVHIPTSATRIGWSAFANSGLTEVTIPDNITLIGTAAFRGTSNLQTVHFTENSKLESIDSFAFRESGLEKFDLPSSVTKIEGSAFQYIESLTDFNIPEDSRLQTLGDQVFWGSAIQSIKLPKQLVSIGSYAFEQSGLEGNLLIPDSVTTLGTMILNGANGVTGVIFSENSRLENITENTFFQAQGLETLVLPPNLQFDEGEKLSLNMMSHLQKLYVTPEQAQNLTITGKSNFTPTIYQLNEDGTVSIMADVSNFLGIESQSLPTVAYASFADLVSGTISEQYTYEGNKKRVYDANGLYKHYCKYQTDFSSACFTKKGRFLGRYDAKGNRIYKKIYTVEEAMEATKNGERFHVFLTYK